MKHSSISGKYEQTFRRIIAGICISAFLIMMSGCDLPLQGDETENSQTTTATSAATTIAATAATETSLIPETTTVPTTETTTETTTVPAYSNPESMYSSYAHFESFDPATGLARFDYFDILKGQDAIDWLVAHEGYTVADATALVNEFADSEYVYKNVNPQLRTADMREVEIRMLYRPNGTMLEGAETIPMTYADFANLYATSPHKVTDTFFYYLTVTDGEITEVAQFYWP